MGRPTASERRTVALAALSIPPRLLRWTMGVVREVARGSHVPGLYAAHEAAEKLAANDLEGALALLADSCGLPVEEWVRITRAEQGR